MFIVLEVPKKVFCASGRFERLYNASTASHIFANGR